MAAKKKAAHHKRKPNAYNRFISSYLREHPGEVLADAVLAYRGGGHTTRHRRSNTGSGTVRITEGGQPSAGGRTLRTTIGAYVPVKWNEVQIGALWTGFLQQARRGTGPDVEAYFPPEDKEGEVSRHWKDLADERAIGGTMFEGGGVPLLYYKVSRDEWMRIYDKMQQQLRGLQAGATPGGAWTSPLEEPSAVTSTFGAAEGFRKDEHRGMDLRAPIGSHVTAPYDLKIERIYNDTDGGLTVRAAARRLDGTFPVDVAGRGPDYSGWRVYFAHLSDVLPMTTEGAEIPEGQTFALSGATGKVTGPHLHVATEWVQDNALFDDRVFVDPQALMPNNVIAQGSGSGAMGPPIDDVDGVAKAITVHKGDTTGTSQREVGVTILNSGVIGIGQTNTYQGSSSTVFGGGKGELSLRDPDAIGVTPLTRDPFNTSGFFGGQVRTIAQDTVKGLGELAGNTFKFVTSPEGVAAVRQGAAGLASLGQVGLGLASTIGPLVAPFANAIPYVGPVFSAVLTALGPIGAIAGPIFGAGATALNGPPKASPFGPAPVPAFPKPFTFGNQ